MFKKYLIQYSLSYIRYIAFSFAASMNTYLVMEAGLDEETAGQLVSSYKEIVNHIVVSIPAVIAVIWSNKKNKKQVQIKEEYEEIITPKRKPQKGLRNEDFN